MSAPVVTIRSGLPVAAGAQVSVAGLDLCVYSARIENVDGLWRATIEFECVPDVETMAFDDQGVARAAAIKVVAGTRPGVAFIAQHSMVVVDGEERSRDGANVTLSGAAMPIYVHAEPVR